MDCNKILSLTALTLAGAGVLYVENNFIQVTEYKYVSDRLPKSFDGYRIVQISDLHGKKFGKNERNLIKKIIALKPDAVISTGDMFSSNGNGIDSAARIVSALSQRKIPFLCVSGNHEAWMKGYSSVKSVINDSNGCCIDSILCEIKRKNEKITFIGIEDERFFRTEYSGGADSFAFNLKGLCDSAEGFRILLAHRPHRAKLYASTGVDIVFCGHAHGGQFGIPFTGRGVYAPEQGFLPKYTQGCHQTGKNTVEIISRGLGNSSFPFRLFNRPEIVLTVLKTGAQ